MRQCNSLSIYIFSLNLCMGLLPQIKRCGEMARKLRFLKEQMMKAGLTPSTRTTTCPNINLDELEVCLFHLLVFKAHHGMLFFFISLFLSLLPWFWLLACAFNKFWKNGKFKLGELEAELVEMNTNTEKLQHSYNELLEYKLVLQKVRLHYWC